MRYIKFAAYGHFSFLLLVGVIIIAATGVATHRLDPKTCLQSTATVAGGVAGLLYFIQNQRIAEIQVLCTLVTRFNERYDSLQSDLSSVVATIESDRSAADRLLKKYFDLCSEEFFYHKQNIIHPDVWATWNSGMRRIYHSHSYIQEFWQAELAKDTYYGMRPEDLM